MPSALLLAWAPELPEGRLDAAFTAVAAAMPPELQRGARDDRRAEGLRLTTWAHPSAFGAGIVDSQRAGSSLALLGNPPIGDGPEDLAALLASLDAAFEEGVDGLSPPFAVVHLPGPGGEPRVAVDRLGLQHVYLHEASDGVVWLSSSSLGLARGLGCALDDMGVAEFLCASHLVSQRSLFKDIRKLAPGERLRLGRDGCSTEHCWLPDDTERGDDERYRSAVLAALRTVGDLGVAQELTGGLDSRLILAGRARCGLAGRAWTFGPPGSEELRIVERLKRRLAFEHRAVTVEPAIGARIPELTARWHELCDGESNALVYSFLLEVLPQLDGWRTVSLSGLGGEVVRTFYAAALTGGGRDIDSGTLLSRATTATRPVIAAMRRDRFPDPTAALRAALEERLASSRMGSAAGRLDDLYVRSRMQRFAGRNLTTTGYLSRQAIPLFHDRVMAAAFALSPERKRHGAVLSDALLEWSPGLAAVPLDNGMSVIPPGPRAPVASARYVIARGRRALQKYGGRAGAALARRPPGSVPWQTIQRDPVLGAWVRDCVCAPDARIGAVLDPQAVRRLVDDALSGHGDLFPLGLAVTLELTLRAAAPRGL
jgi:hypothetical protein